MNHTMVTHTEDCGLYTGYVQHHPTTTNTNLVVNLWSELGLRGVEGEDDGARMFGGRGAQRRRQRDSVSD